MILINTKFSCMYTLSKLEHDGICQKVMETVWDHGSLSVKIILVISCSKSANWNKYSTQT